MKDLLSGVRVIDLTRLLPGPYATLLMADLGAEVIKIEEPDKGDPVRRIPPFHEGKSTRFMMLNRNKKSVTLNLKQPRGAELFLELIQGADVVIENFRPGVMRRMGLDYEVLCEYNPEIVYCALSGYGQEGLYRDHVGHDVNYIARAGLLSLTGESPIIPGVPVADLAGSMFAAFSVLAALRSRDQGHGGTFLDVSLTDAVISWLSIHFAELFPTGQKLNPKEMILTGGFPCYAVYETKDSKYLAVGALEDKFWAKLCEQLGCPEYVQHQFSETHRDEIFERFQSIFSSKPQSVWLDELDPNEVPIAPVLDLTEVARNPHVQQRGLIKGDGLAGVSFPVRWHGLDEGEDQPAPTLGEHNWEFYGQIGYSRDEIGDLERENVI